MEYAALVSLVHITDEILDFDDSDLRFFPFTKEKIVSFKETIDSLLAFLDKYPPICSQRVQDLMTEIREASYEAEAILESLIATHFLQKDVSDRYQIFPENSFEEIVEKLESINMEVWKIQLDGGISALDNDMEMKLMQQLVGGRSKLVVIPIVGMGGSGKTTLARTLYDSQLVKENFGIRGWATISQTYVVKEIVENILKVIGVPLDGKQNVEQYLYQTLRKSKYLIVLDDVWEREAWDVIKRLLPDDNNGSRIILTTRNLDVVKYANFSGTYHEMQALNDKSSWSLFCQVVFVQKNCPPELVEIGKEIVKRCHGLPFLISAVGGHLKKDKKTIENWTYISESIASVSKTDDLVWEILTLIYDYLPHHLKALFLYFGSFQEGRPIDVFTIVNMWIAEGFVEPSRSRSMEEVAKEYLADMIDRNLVSVVDRDSSGNVKRCGIHDLFRDLCTMEALKEKFLYFLNRGIPSDHMEIYSQRRLILNQHIEGVKSAYSHTVSRDCSLLATRSLIFHGDWTFSSTIKLAPGLLKVLKISVKSMKFPIEILELVNLKYLQLGYVSEKIPSSISRLRNLQTFIATCVGAKQDLPSEIWEMLQLRHIVTSGFYLPLIPDVQSKGINMYGLKNLSTLKEMPDSSCTQEVLIRIPNVTELYVFYTMPFDSSNNLASLCKLESLHCVFEFKDEPYDNIMRNNYFPVSLKKLVLRGCRIPWANLSMIGALPNLEVLKLIKAMVGNLWETNAGEFKQLRTLSIEKSELKVWNTEVDHFPRLEHLKLKFCSVLEEIPSEIGEILTLETIELTKCSHAAESSVKEMLEEGLEIGKEIRISISSL